MLLLFLNFKEGGTPLFFFIFKSSFGADIMVVIEVAISHLVLR